MLKQLCYNVGVFGTQDNFKKQQEQMMYTINFEFAVGGRAEDSYNVFYISADDVCIFRPSRACRRRGRRRGGNLRGTTNEHQENQTLTALCGPAARVRRRVRKAVRRSRSGLRHGQQRADGRRRRL